MAGEVAQTHTLEFKVVSANTWETFTFDTPYTQTYTSIYLGVNQPGYRILIHSAKSGTGTDVDFEQILFQNESLTGFQARSPEPNTVVLYSVIPC